MKQAQALAGWQAVPGLCRPSSPVLMHEGFAAAHQWQEVALLLSAQGHTVFALPPWDDVPALHIQLLGDFQLTYGGEPLTAINHARQQALMAHLLLHRGAPQSRQHLAFLFWPDTGEAQALTNLRNLLHKLRQNLPEPERFLQTDTQTVQWRPDAPYTLDVAAFEASLAQAATRADLEQAASLYRGDLLPSCYDDWILPERTRLQQMAVATFERLIALLEAQREVRAAIGYAERLRQIDPLNEATCRTLMRLHAAADDRAGALRIYHTCVRTLQEELSVDPSPETQAHYHRLLNMGAMPSPVKAAPGQPPLVGRQAEWKFLQDAWHAASSGEAHCVILTGEAGIGKTRLAEELLAWTSRQGLASAAARCYAAEGALAYAPVAAWLRSPALAKRLAALDAVWLTEVVRVLPELLAARPRLPRPGPLAESWQRQRLFEALARAVLRPEEPLLLFVDDLQWCDSDTLEWLRYLLHFDRKARLLVVGAVRAEDFTADQPLVALVSALRQEGQVSELALGPLSVDETASLAAHMVEHELTPQQSARLHQETEGNPLFVVETARFGLGSGEPQTEAQDRQAPRQLPAPNPQSLPPKVHAVLHARLAQLSPEARELAGLAAAVGREFTFPLLASASDQDGDALVRSLDELWQRRIVREQDADGYDFTHDKLREVAYASLSAARRRLLHRRVAQALEAVHGAALDTVSGQIATHYELAGLFERAVPYYQQAAEVAHRVYANLDAIRHYRRALALLTGPAGPSPALAADLHERLGDILHWTTQHDEARAAFQKALATLPDSESVGRARVQRKIGNTWREQHRYGEALQLYAAAERVLDEAQTGRASAWWQEWIQVMLETNLVYYWLGQVAESDDLRPELQAAVEQHGIPGQRAAYYQSTGWIEFRRNRSVATDEVVALAKAGLAAQIEAGNQAALPAAHFGVGFAMLWHGDPQEAMEPLQTALQLAGQTGDVNLQARCLTYLTIAYRQRQQVEETRRCAARSLVVAAEAHMPEYGGTAQANHAWVAWQAGELDLARELGRTALAFWRQLPAGHASAPFQWLALWPLIAVALHEEQPSLAVEYVRNLLDLRQQRLPDALVTSLEQAVQAWDGGAPESARSLLQQSMTLAQQMHYL